MPKQVFKVDDFVRELGGFYSSIDVRTNRNVEQTDGTYETFKIVTISSPHVRFDKTGTAKVEDVPTLLEIELKIDSESGYASIEGVRATGPLAVLLEKYGFKE